MEFKKGGSVPSEVCKEPCGFRKESLFSQAHNCLICRSFVAYSLSHVLFFAIPWTVACQVPLHGIFQATVLEWVAIFFSKESSRPRDWTHVSCIGRQILLPSATREASLLIEASPKVEFIFPGRTLSLKVLLCSHTPFSSKTTSALGNIGMESD